MTDRKTNGQKKAGRQARGRQMQRETDRYIFAGACKERKLQDD